MTIIATRANQAKYDAVAAEAIAVDYLYTLAQKISTEEDQTDWKKRLVGNILTENGRVVLRTLFISSKAYIEHLRSIKGWDNKTIPLAMLTALSESLPEALWMVEVSLPELFPANRRKLGEIVLDPSKLLTSDKDLSSFIFARLLEKLYCMQVEKGARLTLIVEKNLGINGHTELYPE
jgi:CO dehydrogenase/acetyl-CoA synthase gamma subunit (corrinoid Fe-S protein)